MIEDPLPLVLVAGVRQETRDDERDPAHPKWHLPASDSCSPPKKDASEVAESDDRENDRRDSHVRFVIHTTIVANNATVYRIKEEPLARGYSVVALLRPRLRTDKQNDCLPSPDANNGIMCFLADIV